MIYEISYANGSPFKKYQKLNALTARIIGRADKTIKYSKKDIPIEYINAHSDIFRYKRGAGLWLWKPFVINETLKIMNDGDWLFYSDASCFFVSSIKKIVRHAVKNDLSIMLFGLPLLNRQFCKSECFVKMGLQDNGENQALGTYILMQKTPKTVSIMQEWLSLCEKEDMITPFKRHDDIPEFPDLFAHREDQSLLSLIGIKYNIPLNKECSNFAIFPYEYCFQEFDYKPMQFTNCKYGVILICHRAENPFHFYLSYLKMRLLKMLGLKYTEKQCLNNPPSAAGLNRNFYSHDLAFKNK